jgi:hypothetical protein
MGGLGSGRQLGREPRRVVERAFALDIKQVITTRLVPGTQGEVDLWAPLIAWPVHAFFLIRSVESIVVTMWFDRPIGDRLLHIPIDVPPPGASGAATSCARGQTTRRMPLHSWRSSTGRSTTRAASHAGGATS